MTQLATAPPQGAPSPRATGPWLTAIAIVPILATVHSQTRLVLTDVTSDVIRDGIDGGKYDMIWTGNHLEVATLYELSGSIWAMVRFGSRETLLVGLVWFALGNLFCGAAWSTCPRWQLRRSSRDRQGMVIVICRSLLYRQFDRMLIVAIGFYGVVAYATRPATPLFTAFVNNAAVVAAPGF